MKNLILALLFSLATVASAAAQGCGAGNPNCVAPTPPTSPSCDNSTRIANTAFVHACGGGGSGTLTAGTTPTSGFTAGQLIESDGAHIQPLSVVSVPFGGTGAGLWSAGLPLIGNGGGALAQGTRSGNTTQFGTVSGSLTAGDCIKIDASGNLIDSGGSCGGSSNAPVFQAFSSPGAVTTLTLTATPLPTSAGLVSITFDGRYQARSTWSLNIVTGVITFTNAIPANTGVVEVDWWAPSTLAGVASLAAGSSTLTGAVTLVAGSNITLTPSGQNITIASSSAVSSVSNSDGSLTISPTTGAVIASLNTAHPLHLTGGATVNGGFITDTFRGYADLRQWASLSCNTASPSSTNVAAAAWAANQAGWTHFFMPAGCYWDTSQNASVSSGAWTNYNIPANFTVLGENWTQSGIAAGTGNLMTLGANTELINVFDQDSGCFNIDGGVYGHPAMCPIGDTKYGGAGNFAWYPFQSAFYYCVQRTIPAFGGNPAIGTLVDQPCLGIQDNSAGDALFLNQGSGNSIYNLINGYGGGGAIFVVKEDGKTIFGNSTTNHSGNGMITIIDATASCGIYTNTSTPGFACSSDRRLKSHILDAAPELDWLNSFHIKDFVYNPDGKQHTGVIAQDLQTRHPDMVHESSAVDPHCNCKPLLAASPNEWKMIKAMQEMQAEIIELRRKIAWWHRRSRIVP